MILSVSMRTDIIGFYFEWYLNRINEGYVLVRNPYHSQMVSRYEINPRVVDFIFYCTKNPRPLVNHLQSNPNSKLWEYRSIYHVSLTPYKEKIESGVPKITQVIQSIRELSLLVGKNKVVWRYDPICLTKEYTYEYHIEQFTRMARLLSGYVEVCIISFVDFYEKTKRNAPFLEVIPKSKMEQMAKEMNEIARTYQMELRLCAEDLNCAQLGISKLGCVEVHDLERIFNVKLKRPKETISRKQCHCLPMRDMGAYNSCLHGCLYCYANEDSDIAVKNYKLHNPISPFLIGEKNEEDEIHYSKQISYLDREQTLFDVEELMK